MISLGNLACVCVLEMVPVTARLTPQFPFPEALLHPGLKPMNAYVFFPDAYTYLNLGRQRVDANTFPTARFGGLEIAFNTPSCA